MRWASSFLRSSSRSEPYPAPALVISPHIGFRTVLGVFFPDTSGWPPQVHASDTLGITVTCAKSDLISFVGTSSLKIAFVKDDNINRRVCYIDFTSAAPGVRVIPDSIKAYGPTLSPNGACVAYGSKGIGFSTPSQTAVWRLGDSSKLVRPYPGVRVRIPAVVVGGYRDRRYVPCGGGGGHHEQPAAVDHRTNHALAA